jgi:hypothetical protein
MKKALVVLLGVCLLALFIGSVSARDVDRTTVRKHKAVTDNEFGQVPFEGMVPDQYLTSALQDTYLIVKYDFETMNWQGWTRQDNTSQVSIFTHVDDFAGIEPGDWGLLTELEGEKSYWCGARPNESDFYLCSWVYAPGYGNNWAQHLEFDPFAFEGIIVFSFRIMNDTEPDWDFSYLEHGVAPDTWAEDAEWDGTYEPHDTSFQIVVATATTKLRFRFVADGAWSDQDGLWNTDGAFIVDSLTIYGNNGITLIDYEDCELASVGDLETDGDINGLYWRAKIPEGYGTFSGLWDNLPDQDPCGENFTSQVVFFVGSGEPSSEYPGIFDTPFCTGPGRVQNPCHDESIISPVIYMDKYTSLGNNVQNEDIPGEDLVDLGGAYLRFTTYRDLPLENCVFYTWSVRNIDPDTGCPGQWLDRNFVYYGPDKDFIYRTEPIGDLVGHDPIQITMGIADMCHYWFEEVCTCTNHTPSPWHDNMRVYRFRTIGPQWSYRSLDLFQDNFPESEFTLEDLIRADMGNDRAPGEEFDRIDPGDSIVVTCAAVPAGGLDHEFNPNTGDSLPKIFMHVECEYIGTTNPAYPANPKPAFLSGPTLEGTYGQYHSTVGNWTIIQGEWAESTPGAVTPDKYMFDLNDSLFTRGYMISYYFSAYDKLGARSTLPTNAETRANLKYGVYGPNPDDYYKEVSYVFEFTCLPLLKSYPDPTMLYVDDFHDRGTYWGNVEQYWNPMFLAVLSPENWPERYDVQGPSSLVSNGLGARSKNNHLIAAYHKIIWDCGDLDSGTICEGTDHSDKGNDCRRLREWANLAEFDVALLIAGDEIACDLSADEAGPDALALLNLCGVALEDHPNACSYFDLSGGRIVGGNSMPLTIGTAGGIHNHAGVPDTLVVDGGCFVTNEFDVLQAQGTGATECLEYPDFPSPGQKHYAAVQKQDSLTGKIFRSVWYGFSFQEVRDRVPTASPPIRNHLFKDAIEFFTNPVQGDITGDETPRAYKLSQNFPNPFNPSTNIKYDMRERGHVSIRIYNVAGQLVKTLVNDVRDAGSYTEVWDGRNNLGTSVASGVYFYKMETRAFSQTKKMVMLR